MGSLGRFVATWLGVGFGVVCWLAGGLLEAGKRLVGS